MIAIMKENENYYEGDKFDPDKFKEEISDGDWVYFFKDKHGKYYYNKRTMREDSSTINIWVRIVSNKNTSHQASISIYCVDRTYYFDANSSVFFSKLIKHGGNPIPPRVSSGLSSGKDL